MHSLGSIRKEVREIDGIEITSDLDTGDKLTHPRECDQHLEYGQFILPTDGSGRPTDTSEASLIKTKIYELLFADDAGILTTTAESLQYLLQVYDKYFKMFGLELAIEKTEVMHCDHRQNNGNSELAPAPPLQIWLPDKDGELRLLKVVSVFKYLGVMFANHLDHLETEIDRRLQLGSAAFGRKEREFFKDYHFNRLAKLKFLLEEIMPTIQYGIELWNVKPHTLRRIESWLRHKLYIIFHIHSRDHVGYWRLLHYFNYHRIRIYPLHIQLAQRRLKYYGRVARLENWRLVKLVHFGTVVNKCGPNKVRRGINWRSYVLLRDRIPDDCEVLNIIEGFLLACQVENIWNELVTASEKFAFKRWIYLKARQSLLREWDEASSTDASYDVDAITTPMDQLEWPVGYEIYSRDENDVDDQLSGNQHTLMAHTLIPGKTYSKTQLCRFAHNHHILSLFNNKIRLRRKNNELPDEVLAGRIDYWPEDPRERPIVNDILREHNYWHPGRIRHRQFQKSKYGIPVSAEGETTNLRRQMELYGYDLCYARYGHDAEHDAYYVNCVINDADGPRRGRNASFHRAKFTDAVRRNKIFLPSAARNVTTLHPLEDLINSGREKGLVCQAKLARGGRFCTNAINLTRTDHSHGGQVGIMLCKVHLRQHVNRAKIPRVVPVTEVDIPLTGVVDDHSAIPRCIAIKKTDGQVCGNKLKPGMIHFCGKHQPRA